MRRTWFIVSANEWIASENKLPDQDAINQINFKIVIKKFQIIADKTAINHELGADQSTDINRVKNINNMWHCMFTSTKVKIFLSYCLK